jgi:uncharacterized protein YjbI with pentapeptide repeats
MFRKKTPPKAVIDNQPVVLLQNPYFNLITRFLPLQDLGSLALTSKFSYTAFINRLCNPDFLFSLLNHLNHHQLEAFQRHLNRTIYDKLKLITDNDVKQEHHTAYVCWALLCGNMMLIDGTRLASAWSQASEGKDVAEHIQHSTQFIIRFHTMRNLYISAVSDNADFNLFDRTTKLHHPNRAKLQGMVTIFLRSMCTHTFYYNTNHADFCFFTNAFLQNFNLSGINLSGAIITNGSMIYANLSNANLSGVSFRGQCTLQGSNTCNTNFSNADLSDISIAYNNFSDTDLTNVSVDYFDFDHYFIRGVDSRNLTQFVKSLNNLPSKLDMFMTMNFINESGLNHFKVLIANELKVIFNSLPLISEADIKLLIDISEHEFFRLPRKISFFTKKVLATERSPSQRILDDTVSTLVNREQVDDNDWEDLGKNANHEHASNISPGK